MTCKYFVRPFGCGHPIVLIDRSRRAQHLDDETWCTDCMMRKETEDEIMEQENG